MACVRLTDPEVTHQIAQYFLLFIHGAFLLVGTGLIVGSMFAFVDWERDATAFLTHQNLPNLAVAGLVIGCVLVVLSCFGVLAGLIENRCMLILNSLFLVLTAVLFICLGTSVFTIRQQLRQDVLRHSGDIWASLQSSWLQAVQINPAAVCAAQLFLGCTGFANGLPYGGLPAELQRDNSTLAYALLGPEHDVLKSIERFLNPHSSAIPGWSQYCINPNNTNHPGATGAHKKTYCTAYKDCSELYKKSPTEKMAYLEGCVDKLSVDLGAWYLALGSSFFGCALLLLINISSDCCLFYHNAVESTMETQSLMPGDSMELGMYGPRRCSSAEGTTGSDSGTSTPPKFREYSYGTSTTAQGSGTAAHGRTINVTPTDEHAPAGVSPTIRRMQGGEGEEHAD